MTSYLLSLEIGNNGGIPNLSQAKSHHWQEMSMVPKFTHADYTGWSKKCKHYFGNVLRLN